MMSLALLTFSASCSSSATDPVPTAASPVETVQPDPEPDTPVDAAATAAPSPEAQLRPAEVDPSSVPRGEVRNFGPPPEAPVGPLPAEAAEAIDTLLGPRLLDFVIDERSFAAIETLGASGDPRVAWWLSDLMRIGAGPTANELLIEAQSTLLGTELDPATAWGDTVDRLIAWDIPAPPEYLKYKRNVYLVIEPRWAPLFEDNADIDWRILSWGGVRIDNRPYDRTDERCNCIPAADNPPTTDVAGGDAWLGEDTIVFGVVINDQARAYPRSIMEVREMVNDSLGGRDFAMPYCTLCGSAQVFFTDDLPEGVDRPILRTSGLLSRSNKVMYDLNTFSIFDTFRGLAVSGPLGEIGLELEQNSVITTTWGRWKADHPDTTVLDVALALGRQDSDLRNTRDADGPIFPIGDVDPRLPIQDDVLGVVTDAAGPIAFHVASAIAALERGEFIEVDGIAVVLDGGGVRALDADGNDLGGHQAFWFAWSQFHPGTRLWPG